MKRKTLTKAERDRRTFNASAKELARIHSWLSLVEQDEVVADIRTALGAAFRVCTERAKR